MAAGFLGSNPDILPATAPASAHTARINNAEKERSKIKALFMGGAMLLIRVRQESQITLPSAVMEAANIQPDDLLAVTVASGVVTLRPVPSVRQNDGAIMQYAGSCKGAWGVTPKEIEENLQEDRASWDG